MLVNASLTRRRFLASAAVVGGAAAAQGLLGACAPKPQPAPTVAPAAPAAPVVTKPTDPPAKTQESVEISLMTWWLPPLVYGTATDTAVAEFQKAHPTIKVTIEPNPGGIDAQMQKWQTSLAAGAPPDVSLMRPHFQNAFAARGALLAVDELLASTTGVKKEDFWPQTIKRLTHEGTLWGLPAEIWFSFILVNMDMFSKAGIEKPGSDWSYDDFLEISTKLTQGTGVQKEFGTTPLTGFWQVPVWAWGGNVLDAEEKSCVVDKDPAPDAIQWNADLIVKDKVAPSSEDLADQGAQALFETGRIAMHNSANWYIGDAKKNIKAEFDIVPMPVGPKGRSALVQGANYCIFKLTKAPEAAWELMLDLSAGNGQEIMVRESTLFPTIQSLATLSHLPNYRQEWIDVSLICAEVARANHFVPSFVEMNTAMNKELGEVWVGRKSAKEAAEAMVPVVNGILEAQ
jgi:multiple sugar transport system substrate-binding protein